MIDLPGQHPEFDLLLEIIATLPAAPATARANMLRQDFGIKTVRGLRQVLAPASRRGVRVNIVPGGSVAWIESEHAEYWRKVCNGYWDRVHARNGKLRKKRKGAQ